MNASDREFLARLHDGIDRAERKTRDRKLGTAMLLVACVAAAFAWPREPESIAVPEPPPESRVQDPVASLLLEAARLRLDGFGDPAAAAPRLRTIIHDYPHTREADQARALLQGETS